jgi:hypothetical protein
MHHSRLFALFTSLLWSAGCTGKREEPVFKLLSPDETGVTFANTITTNFPATWSRVACTGTRGT